MNKIFKTKKSLLIVAIAGLSFYSCEDFLDRGPMTDLTEDLIFNVYDNACAVARSVYADIPNGLFAVWSSTAAMMAAATDESEFAIQDNNVQKFNTGSWGPNDLPENPWSGYYKSIRKTNNFLANAHKINLDDVRLDPSQKEVYEYRLKDIESWKNEMCLLRAYFYFELLRRYGGIPIVNELYGMDSNPAELKRNTMEECVDYIVYWCDSTAKVLPAKRVDAELGRLTRGVAYALKSRVLLYAASDLWNDPSWAAGYVYPELISMSNNKDRTTRWREAAAASKELLDDLRESKYQEDSPKNLFGPKNYQSNAVILCHRDGDSNSFEKVNFPIGFDNVSGGNCPSQDIVDAFDVKLGSTKAIPFDWSNPEHAANPYANRDPRLEMSVIVNSSSFGNRTIECWQGGRDGAGVKNATPTGYYLKKYVNGDLDLLQDRKSVHSWVIFRICEIYLNYIEALNECDPGHVDIKKYYDKIRARKDVLMPRMSSGLGQDEIRQLIRKERQVELAFEGHRWFDLRRWMDEVTLKKPLRAVEVTKSENGFTYKPYVLENRSFEKKTYFYPIPQSELNKTLQWKQNPLW